MCVFIKLYRDYLYRPTTKFYYNLFFLKNNPSTNMTYTLVSNFLIETDKNLKIKKLQEINLKQFYNFVIISLYLISIINIFYLFIKINVNVYI